MSEASVDVESQTVGAIGRGLVVLVGVTHEDADTDARWLADKIAHLRIFEDSNGKFNLSALDVNAEMLVVSQFTLYADTRRGRRPDFIAAAHPEHAEPLVDKFCAELRAFGIAVTTGKFQAHMLVRIFNDGPATIWLDSKTRS